MRIHAVRDASVAGAARAHTSVGSLLFFGKEGDVHSSHVRPSISFGTGLAPSP